MKKYLIISMIFITATSYDNSYNKLSPSEERFLIQKSLDSTEREIERINKFLDNPYRRYEIKNK